MSEGAQRRSWILISRDWGIANALAILAYLSFGWLESGYAFSVLPVMIMGAQAFYLRRHVKWWLWLPYSLLGSLLSLVFLMYWYVVLGCTISLAQSLCLGGRPLVALVLWPLLGCVGWLLPAYVYAHLGLPPLGWAASWAFSFGMQSLFLLPAVIFLEKSGETPSPA